MIVDVVNIHKLAPLRQILRRDPVQSVSGCDGLALVDEVEQDESRVATAIQ